MWRDLKFVKVLGCGKFGEVQLMCLNRDSIDVLVAVKTVYDDVCGWVAGCEFVWEQ